MTVSDAKTVLVGDVTGFKGDNITITIVPKENFMVGKWIVDGNVTDICQKTFTLESMSKNVDVQVDLEAQISARVYYGNAISEATTDGEHFDSGAMVGCGTTLAFHTDPAAGKMVKEWKLNESVVVNKYGKPLVDNTYIIDGLAGTANVAVNFEDILTHSVIVDAANIEYTAKYEPEFAGEIRDGAAGIFTFRAKAGYRIDKSELEQKGIFDSFVYDDMTGEYNCRINGIYSGYSISLKAKELYTISCISAKNGKVTTVPVNAVEGDTVTIVTKPNSGYKFGSVQATYMNAEGQIKDIVITDNTFIVPAAAVTITARFDVDNSGSNGGGGAKVITVGTLEVLIPAL